MGSILSHWRVFAALLLAVGLIGGAYAFSQGAAHPNTAVASSEAALLSAIATRDTDGDGLPDWEEVLYGTDPSRTDTRGLGMTDAEAVRSGLIVPLAVADIATPSGYGDLELGEVGLPAAPAENSLTSAFAKNFFNLYLNAKQRNGGEALTDEDIAAVATDALAELAAAVVIAPPFKTERDVRVSGSGPSALKTYAAAAEAVLSAHKTSATKSEIVYLEQAVKEGSSEPLAQIASTAKAYRSSAAGLIALSVPAELALAHLALINALVRVSETAEDFTRVHSDPVSTMLALTLYPEAVTGLADAFRGIDSTYRSAGVSFEEGEAGATFVYLMRDLTTGAP